MNIVKKQTFLTIMGKKLIFLQSLLVCANTIFEKQKRVYEKNVYTTDIKTL